MRILILDVETQAIEELRGYLKGIGYLDFTECYHRVEEMLEAYRKERPGIVFIRVGHKQFNGLEAARMLKRLDERAKIVFISKFDDYVEFAWELGAIGYLAEPLNHEQFFAMLARAG